MFDIMVVREALQTSRLIEPNSNPYLIRINDDDSIIALLIHDIFGGEILKTHRNKRWHFYNRIDGIRIDISGSEIGKSFKDKYFEDIPSTPNETQNYFVQEDYTSFFMRFIRTFEETVGLDKYRTGLSSNVRKNITKVLC